MVGPAIRTKPTSHYLSAIGECAMWWSSEVISFIEDGSLFLCVVGGSLFCDGRASTAFPSGTPYHKEDQHQRHEHFHLPDTPCATTTSIVRCFKGLGHSNSSITLRTYAPIDRGYGGLAAKGMDSILSTV